MNTQQSSSTSAFDEFVQYLSIELDQSKQTMDELALMLEQSQMELKRLTQRNATVTGQLQQVQGQYQQLSKDEIKSAYDRSLDAQQRLLVMRAQMDRMKAELESVKKYIDILERVKLMFIDDGSGGKGQISGDRAAVLEMVINAQEAVRQRLSRQMHDGPAQALSNFIVQAEIASRLADIDPEKAKAELENLKSSAMGTFQKVRVFIFELRPMMLDDLGLFPTIKRYVDNFKEQSGINVSLSIKGKERRLESYLEVMIFRAIQELLANAAQHNEDLPTKVNITTQIVLDENNIRVTVSDTGKGFDPNVINAGDTFGLKLIRERVEILGGSMDVDSAVGQGSRIYFQIPCLEIGSSQDEQ
jgi:two-component system sensor histidine kinase DegS